tara:strand:+ start:213 stop:440 length:228 start_codon:yes stop_codon:yes gene_type:complete
MKGENCWVWFKDSLKEKGEWKSGFTCHRDEKPGLLIESPAYVSCRLPEWRVVLNEPSDISQPPEIPNNAEWKLNK